jgi:hypothetical protein
MDCSKTMHKKQHSSKQFNFFFLNKKKLKKIVKSELQFFINISCLFDGSVGNSPIDGLPKKKN